MRTIMKVSLAALALALIALTGDAIGIALAALPYVISTRLESLEEFPETAIGAAALYAKARFAIVSAGDRVVTPDGHTLGHLTLHLTQAELADLVTAFDGESVLYDFTIDETP
jgi:hypothetical protein